VAWRSFSIPWRGSDGSGRHALAAPRRLPAAATVRAKNRAARPACSRRGPACRGDHRATGTRAPALRLFPALSGPPPKPPARGSRRRPKQTALVPPGLVPPGPVPPRWSGASRPCPGRRPYLRLRDVMSARRPCARRPATSRADVPRQPLGALLRRRMIARRLNPAHQPRRRPRSEASAGSRILRAPRRPRTFRPSRRLRLVSRRAHRRSRLLARSLFRCRSPRRRTARPPATACCAHSRSRALMRTRSAQRAARPRSARNPWRHPRGGPGRGSRPSSRVASS
jgi:hypothetical protein